MPARQQRSPLSIFHTASFFAPVSSSSYQKSKIEKTRRKSVIFTVLSFKLFSLFLRALPLTKHSYVFCLIGTKNNNNTRRKVETSCDDEKLVVGVVFLWVKSGQSLTSGKSENYRGNSHFQFSVIEFYSLYVSKSCH